ncbi:ribose-phosphate pyrophosphokinase [Leptothrix cholodnii SP-6]|uniref:Ribose-phosphate pyrophosphokinase n=1 Tax=Leptothrix cholodnii (strain ATCC 51168 / LMG 8142 / SP-6) TaxID=395495 RepID=B1Y6C5_LEPCP|nr:ribose-phosphate pyrophosphokinase [Leptothrix cholodnii]ACB34761.1 ribose-phosphate pyrophosphokinase [Leptothrix cholodnii SP-6]
MTISQVLAFDDEQAPAGALARTLGVPLALIGRHRFPDGEIRLRLPAALHGSVLIWRGLQQPNEKLVELLIGAPSARELGAQRLLLVSPYLAYMRQDIAFTPGESVSQRHIARLLAQHFDAVITVDPHLHRIASLDEVMPAGRGVSLSAAGLLGAWAARQVRDVLLLGPDEESAPWVRCAARDGATALGRPQPLDHACCVKQRSGDRDVRVTLPPGLALQGRAVVLIDDIASTGRTLLDATRQCLEGGAASVDVAVTHALFVGDAHTLLRQAGVRHIWSTDCVPHASNAVSVVPLLAEIVRDKFMS